MLLSDLKKGFPKAIPVPPALAQLCAWHEEHGQPISGNFELFADEDGAIESWFGTPSVKKQFGVFGVGGDGSLLAVWRQDDGRMPVVRLDSESVDNHVLAGDFVQFLRLLAIGYGELRSAYFDVLPKDAPNEEFQDWVCETFKVTLPATGAEITKPAQAQHDDFDGWAQSKVR